MAGATGLEFTDEFATALAHLQRGDSLFLTGKAGTGKSTLIRTFLAQANRQVIVAAPTGIAALNVGGYTLHRLFSFPTGVTPEFAASPNYYPGRFAQVLRGLDTLIIDEVSMVRADLMDALAIALERFGPWPGRPFGGVQLVLVGDLYQLPPVVASGEETHFRERYPSPYFFDADAYVGAPLPTVELTKVFRQQGDDRLVEILNHTREGTLLEEARALLNERTNPDFVPPPEEMWLTLTTTNRMADARNRQMLERLNAPLITASAQVRGDTGKFDAPTQAELEFKVGAQIMLLNNDPEDRWANGTIAQIERHFYTDSGINVQVRLPDGQLATVSAHTWEITQPVVSNGRLHHEVVGTFTQLPFRLAWAITIHKSQGQTLDRVVVDLTGGTFSDGQLYVALSRCTSLAGMVLRRPVLPKDLKVDARIRRFSHTSAGGQVRGVVYLAANFVGTTGSRWRPRPVELAAITEDGARYSTLINPTMDLGSARTDYGISAGDLTFAPLLAEAWGYLAPIVAGRIPVAHDADELLGLLDFELKRGGLVAVMPMPVDVRTLGVPLSQLPRGPITALAKCEQLYEAGQLVAGGAGLAQWLAGDASQVASPFAAADERAGYLLARGADPLQFGVRGPGEPGRVLGELLAERGPWDPRQLSPHEQSVLTEISRRSGVVLLADDAAHRPLPIAQVLVPGARICFTGTAHGDDGQEVPRHWLEQVARAHGLEPVANVTKTRCEALIVAEHGTLSGKARKAADYGKPIFTVAQLCDWAGVSEQAGFNSEAGFSSQSGFNAQAGFNTQAGTTPDGPEDIAPAIIIQGQP